MAPESEQPAADIPVKSPAQFSLAGLLGKIILLILILAVGAVGVLYAIGTNEIQFQVQQEITGKRADIYKLITNYETVNEWVTAVESCEPVGEIKTYKRGAKAKVVMTVEGEAIELDHEVTFARQNLETEMKMTSDMFDLVQRYKLDFKNDAGLASDVIVVTSRSKIQFKGSHRIMAPFLKQSLQA
ncbi:MAG: hypothetical protein VX438_16965, partial [Planctomycetota bacterium]|nr:hypothetical protein [Planctomycetota bacterium]